MCGLGPAGSSTTRSGPENSIRRRHDQAPFLAGLAVVLTFLPHTVDADAHCHERKFLVSALQNDLEGKLVMRGFGDDGSMFETFAAPDGSWSIIRTRPQEPRVSCVMAVGPLLELIVRRVGVQS